MSEVDPKNSPVREATKDYFYKAAEYLHSYFPNMTANQLTMLRALALIGASEALINTDDDRILKFASSIAYTAFELADGIDGHLANIEAQEQNRETNLRGNLYDALSDKATEVYNCFRIAERSFANGDQVGGVINVLAGISCPLPATLRARAEKHNMVVKENGLGTRPVRATMIGLNVAFGGNRFISTPLGVIVLAMNAYTTARRIGAVDNPNCAHVIGTLDNDKKQLEAKLRYPSLGAFTVASAGIGGYLLKRKFSKK